MWRRGWEYVANRTQPERHSHMLKNSNLLVLAIR
jgi:hypothetical protein